MRMFAAFSYTVCYRGVAGRFFGFLTITNISSRIFIPGTSAQGLQFF